MASLPDPLPAARYPFTLSARIWMVLAAALLPFALFTLFLVWMPPTQPTFATIALCVLLLMMSLLIGALGMNHLVVHWQRRFESRVKTGASDPSVFAQPLPPETPADIAAMDAALAVLAQKILAAEQTLQDLTSQNEHLLREVHHRVKNSMQIVASLLSLHASRIHEDRGTVAFAAALARINALTSIHREMYAAENLREIDLCAFLTGLLAHTSGTTAPQARVQLTAETGDTSISPTTALPLGMLMLEAIGQANDSGRLRSGTALAVAMAIRTLDDGRISMVLHYPAAVPEWLTEQSGVSASLGQTLVRAYVRQLDAQLDTDVREDESSLRISLPASLRGGS